MVLLVVFLCEISHKYTKNNFKIIFCFVFPFLGEIFFAKMGNFSSHFHFDFKGSILNILDRFLQTCCHLMLNLSWDAHI